MKSAAIAAIDTEVKMLRNILFAAFAAVLVATPFQSADAAGCPSDLGTRQALSNADYDRLCGGGQGRVTRGAPVGSDVYSRSYAVALDVRSTCNLNDRSCVQVMQNAERARQFDARYALAAGQQVHRQGMDRDRSDLQWAQFGHRKDMNYARLAQTNTRDAHRRKMDVRRQDTRDFQVLSREAARWFDTVIDLGR